MRGNTLLDVFPLSSTRIRPSTTLDRTIASVTIATGGVSNMTKSNFFLVFCMNSSILWPAINSDGFGGFRPPVTSETFSMSVSCIMSSIFACPERNRLSPLSFFFLKIPCRRGFLISASTRSTRFPFWAMAIARLQAVVVLPSCGPGLVISCVFRGHSSVAEKSMLVLIALYASEAGSLGLMCTHMSFLNSVILPLSSLISGMPPKKGHSVSFLMSSTSFTVSSRYSKKNARPTPPKNPTIIASNTLSFFFGFTGNAGTSAASSMFTLFALSPSRAYWS